MPLPQIWILEELKELYQEVGGGGVNVHKAGGVSIRVRMQVVLSTMAMAPYLMVTQK